MKAACRYLSPLEEKERKKIPNKPKMRKEYSTMN
jgi:hypothetical protein